jgi:creatinine amidohydrolase
MIDSMAGHGSWMENFPWTRLEGVALPKRQKQMLDSSMKMRMSAEEFRKYLGDGNYGGFYARTDEEMLELWEVAVADVRFQLEYEWE